MAFSLPTFNLVCNVFTGPAPIVGPPRLSPVCNLAVGRRVQQPGQQWGSDGAIGMCPSLLLPPLTDVRDLTNSTGYDFIEVPAGSGRVYQVSLVEDIGKGFSNEHRAAALVKASSNIDPVAYAGIVWPTPMT
jgi:hypothetical protein